MNILTRIPPLERVEASNHAGGFCAEKGLASLNLTVFIAAFPFLSLVLAMISVREFFIVWCPHSE